MRILIEIMPESEKHMFHNKAFSYVRVVSGATRIFERLNDDGLFNPVYLDEQATQNCIKGFKDLTKKCKKGKSVPDIFLYYLSSWLCKKRPWEDNDLYYEMMDKYGVTNEKGQRSIPLHRWWDGSVTRLINSKKAETA